MYVCMYVLKMYVCIENNFTKSHVYLLPSEKTSEV